MKKNKARIFGIAVILFLTGALFLMDVFWPRMLGGPDFSFLGGWEQGERTDISPAGWIRVARVVDGDTIELENGEKVRYIGVNAPESVDLRRPVQCFGKEASAFNEQLVEGKMVRLEKGISERDKYGRLLRFVYLEDETFVNELLVREGYAYASPYAPDVSKKEMFREAENEARKNVSGLWGPDTCSGKK